MAGNESAKARWRGLVKGITQHHECQLNPRLARQP